MDVNAGLHSNRSCGSKGQRCLYPCMLKDTGSYSKISLIFLSNSRLLNSYVVQECCASRPAGVLGRAFIRNSHNAELGRKQWEEEEGICTQ